MGYILGATATNKSESLQARRRNTIKQIVKINLINGMREQGLICLGNTSMGVEWSAKVWSVKRSRVQGSMSERRQAERNRKDHPRRDSGHYFMEPEREACCEATGSQNQFVE